MEGEGTSWDGTRYIDRHGVASCAPCLVHSWTAKMLLLQAQNWLESKKR